MASQVGGGKTAGFTAWLNQRLAQVEPDLTALAASAGISYAYLCMLRAGQRAHPSKEVVDALAAALGSSLDEARQAAGLSPAPAAPVTRVHAPRTTAQPPGAAFDRTWYIPRPAQETQALSFIQAAGAPATIWGPAHFGKTWLLRRVLLMTSDPGTQIALVNLRTEIPVKRVNSLDGFFHELIVRIGETLDLREDDPEGSPLRWPPEPGFGTPCLRFTTFVEERILKRLEGRLVLAIDQVDELLEAGFRDDLFGMLRSWADNAVDEPWVRLRLLFSTSTHPNQLTRSDHPSPFNLTPPIQLQEFDRSEVQQLGRLHRIACTEEMLDEWMSLVGGHPYLIRLPLWTAATGRNPMQGLGPHPDLDQSVWASYLQGRLRWLRQSPILEEAIRGLLQGENLSPESNAFHDLQNAGLVRQESNRVRIRYPIYEMYLRTHL